MWATYTCQNVANVTPGHKVSHTTCASFFLCGEPDEGSTKHSIYHTGSDTGGGHNSSENESTSRSRVTKESLGVDPELFEVCEKQKGRVRRCVLPHGSYTEISDPAELSAPTYWAGLRQHAIKTATSHVIASAFNNMSPSTSSRSITSRGGPSNNITSTNTSKAGSLLLHTSSGNNDRNTTQSSSHATHCPTTHALVQAARKGPSPCTHLALLHAVGLTGNSHGDRSKPIMTQGGTLASNTLLGAAVRFARAMNADHSKSEVSDETTAIITRKEERSSEAGLVSELLLENSCGPQTSSVVLGEEPSNNCNAPVVLHGDHDDPERTTTIEMVPQHPHPSTSTTRAGGSTTLDILPSPFGGNTSNLAAHHHVSLRALVRSLALTDAHHLDFGGGHKETVRNSVGGGHKKADLKVSSTSAVDVLPTSDAPPHHPTSEAPAAKTEVPPSRSSAAFRDELEEAHEVLTRSLRLKY